MCVCKLFPLCLTFWSQWTVTLQAPLFMGFSRQEFWNGLLYSPPGDLSDPGFKPKSFKSPELAS